MMEICDLHMAEFGCSVEQAVRVVSALGSLDGKAWYVLERPERYAAGPLDGLREDWARPRFGSLVVFSPSWELAMEPEEGGRVACRMVCDEEPFDLGGTVQGVDWNPTKGVHFRSMSYILRPHKACEAMLREGVALRYLRYREYFGLDRDGMPVLLAGRLCGLDGRDRNGTRGQEEEERNGL